ncbi:MAG: SDR family NAD(P)-dependent oxidoreductase [Bdellovibrionales bacterium]|nr:SDR family NAD(P)-dependent oxidoreductase [Bdellovibrionales bacterium]
MRTHDSKKALITGASSGIGAATAKLLAAQGFDLLLLARRKDRLESLKKDLLGNHSQISVDVAQVDVTSFEEVQKFFAEFKTKIQLVNVLINNAGLAKGSDPAHLAQWEDWELMLETNIKGLMYLTHQLLPKLIEKAPAHIVNIGSVAGRWTYPGAAVYNATKFAVRAFSEGLRLDLLGKQVRVTNIEPGMVETEFSKVRFEDEEKARAVYQGMKPLTAEDIASTISWCLAQPEHVNIQELVIYPVDQASPQNIYRS